MRIGLAHSSLPGRSGMRSGDLRSFLGLSSLLPHGHLTGHRTSIEDHVPSGPIHIWVMLSEPWESEDQVVFPNIGYGEPRYFFVISNLDCGFDEVGDLS